MATVRFTPHLRRFFPLPAEHESDAASVALLLDELDATWPGLAFYLVDERGSLRQHVAIWVDGQLIADRERLSDALGTESHVTILQALSGG